MTRQQKNKKIYRKNLLDLILDTLFKGLKWLIKTTIRTIIYLIIGIMTITYKLIRLMNKLIAKGFSKLPRLIRVSIIYGLVGLATVGVISIVNPKVEIKTITKDRIVEKVIAKETKENENEETKEQTVDLGNDNANNIYNKAIEMGLTKEQAILVVSISRHETGNWSSKVFNNQNNFGGIMCNSGLKSYDTYQEGLTDFIRILKSYYFDEGLTTIEEIGAKYCPVGAENDPNGLNKYWVSGVTAFYNSYLEK